MPDEFYGRRQKKTRARLIVKRHVRNQRNADVVNRGNADVVRGHINVEVVNRDNVQDVNRGNVEVVNQGAKQENVVVVKHVP